MIRPFVSRHNPLAARPSRARRTSHTAGRPCRRGSRPCRRPSPRPYRGLVQPCPGRIVGVAATPCLLCHDKIHCIVTKVGKWAVAHSAGRKKKIIYIYIYIYIYIIFFFFFIPAIGKPLEKKNIFSFSRRTK